MAIKSQYFFIAVMLFLKQPFVFGEDCKCEGLVSVFKSTMSREIFDLKMENTMLQARMDKMEMMLQEKSSSTSSRGLDTARLERFENRLSSIESNRQHTKKVPTNTLKLHSPIAKALRSEKVKRIQAESNTRKHMQFFNQSISDLKIKFDFVLTSNLTYIVDDIEKVEQKMYDGLDQVKNDIRNLQSNISELQIQSNALSDKDISELGLDLAVMNKSVATDIAEIEQRMSDGFLNVKNKIKTMQSNVTKQYQVNVLIGKNVTALETGLSTIDQDVITMKADIKTLKELSLISLKANKCPKLPSIRNGEIFQNTNEGVRNIYGSVAEYTCNIGYSLNGNKSIKVYNRQCQADRTWSGKQPTCDEGCILPKHAAEYEGQRIVSPGTTLNNFACDRGYVLSSQNGMTCRDGGTWSQIVTCIKGCTLPSHAANHKDHRAIFSPGVTVNNFYCGHGNVLSSEQGMTCQRGGSWSKIVTCIRGCTLPNHAANHKDRGTTFSPGETLNNFACQPGYILSSEKGMTCRRDGSWSEIVTCIKGCTLPSHAANHKDRGTTFSPGETLNNFACWPGYVLSSERGMTCQHGGYWPEIVTCIKGCTLPNHAANHKDRGTTFSPGETLNNFACQPGYVLSSEKGMTCRRSGYWSEIVTCIKVQPKECVRTFDAGHKWYPLWGKIQQQYKYHPGRKLSEKDCKENCLKQKIIPLQSVYYTLGHRTCHCLAVSADSYFLQKGGNWDARVYIYSCK